MRTTAILWYVGDEMVLKITVRNNSHTHLFGQSEIATLYVAGFGSSLITSTTAGTLADKYGRRNGCLAFTLLQIVSTDMID